MTSISNSETEKKPANPRGCVLLFGLLFTAVPLCVLYFWVYPYLSQTWGARDWATTNGTLISCSVEEHTDSDNATTYNVVASYSYEVEGRTFQGNRPTFQKGADSFEDDHRELEQRLQNAQSQLGHITVYYNPEFPYESVLDRSIRWKYLMMQLLFSLIFLAFGIGIMSVSAVMKVKKVDYSDPVIRNKPAGKFGLTFFMGLVFFLVGIFPIMIIEKELSTGNYWVLLLLLFPLIGLLMLWSSFTILREWMRFGEIIVRMDPNPGSIGSDVAGTIELKEPFTPEVQFHVALACIRMEDSRGESGSDSSSKLLWQEEGIAHAESSPMGTVLRFAFEVPDHLPPSSYATHSNDSVTWQLYVNAVLPGPDLDREITLNVEKTSPPRKAQRFVKYSKTLIPDLPPPPRILQLSSDTEGVHFHFPSSRNTSIGFGLLIFGGIFTAISIFIAIVGLKDFNFGNLFGLFFAIIPAMFILLFFGIGILILLFGLHCMLNAKTVTISKNKMLTLKDNYGITSFTKTVALSEIKSVAKKMNMNTNGQGKAIVFYELQGLTREGKKLNLGDGLRGSAMADRVLLKLREEMVKHGAVLEPLEK